VRVYATAATPWAARRALNQTRNILFAVCKGEEVTVTHLLKRYGEVFLALERVLEGEDGLSVVNQNLKIAEIQPHSCAPKHVEHNNLWKTTLQQFKEDSQSKRQSSQMRWEAYKEEPSKVQKGSAGFGPGWRLPEEQAQKKTTPSEDKGSKGKKSKRSHKAHIPKQKSRSTKTKSKS